MHHLKKIEKCSPQTGPARMFPGPRCGSRRVCTVYIIVLANCLCNTLRLIMQRGITLNKYTFINTAAQIGWIKCIHAIKNSKYNKAAVTKM